MNRFRHFRAFVSLVGATALLMACSSGGGRGGGGCPAEAPVTCFNPQGAATGCCATSCDPNGVCLNATGGSGGVAGAFGGTAGKAGSAGSGGASGAAGTGGVAGSGGTTASGGVGGTTGGTGGVGGSTGGTGGVGGTTGGTGGVGGSSGGTGGVGGSTGGTGGVGGSTGGTGGACVDANEPNDSETGATNLGTLNDCDSSGGTLDATLSGSADSDYYKFIGTDSFCIVDPTASTSAAVRLCMFASCPGGSVFCVSGSSATSPGGSQGCCTGNAGGNVQLQIFCNNAPADVTMRVDQGGSACKSYDLSYHY